MSSSAGGNFTELNVPVLAGQLHHLDTAPARAFSPRRAWAAGAQRGSILLVSRLLEEFDI